MGTSYNYFTLAERIEIRRLYAAGVSRAAIARALERHPSSIGRELTRNAVSTKSWHDGYEPVRAHQLAERRRRWDARFKLERKPVLREHVKKRLAMGWSPEQISSRLALEHTNKTVTPELEGFSISHESIYRYIYHRSAQKDFLHRQLPRAKFRRGNYCRKKRSPSTYIADRVSIHERPASVLDRSVGGHWEADLMLFSTYGQALMVCVERASRFVKVWLQPNKSAQGVIDHLIPFFEAMPVPLRQSLTLDNGTEFSFHHQLNKSLGLKTYFCDIRAPWQKGSVENTNGRLRRYLPRKGDTSSLTKEDIDTITDRYNQTPRKILGFQTPSEFFDKNLQALHFNREFTFPPSRE
jgi:IS30 family transposase